MYHDLDVRVASENRTRVLHELARLGYDVVAFTTTVDNVDQLSCETRESQTFNVPKSNVAKTKKSGDHITGNGGRGIRVLERVTIVIDDPSQLVLLTSPALSNFDVVAVRPGSEKLLHQCLQFDFDVLSLILDKKQAFHLKTAHVNVAVEKGIAFEICYADALRDAPARRFLISNACAMSRVTSGRNIILSSGARHIIELRGPHDVVNLGHIFDLTNVNARNCVTSTPENSVNHGDVRVNTHKGTVRIIADDHLTDRMVE